MVPQLRYKGVVRLVDRVRAALERDPKNPPRVYCPICRRPNVKLEICVNPNMIPGGTEDVFIEIHASSTRELVYGLDPAPGKGDTVIESRCPGSAMLVLEVP